MSWFATRTTHATGLCAPVSSPDPPSGTAADCPQSTIRAIPARSARVLLVVLALSPAAFLMAQVTRHWVDVPFADEWDIFVVFDAHFDGGVNWRTLICQHNESRKLIPRLIILGLGLASRGDVRWEICVTLLLASLISLSLFLLLRAMPARSWPECMAMFMLCNLVLFTPAQWINWLSGIQMVAFIPPCMLTWGLLLNSSRARVWPKTVGAAGAAVVATYSYANGMLLWLLLCPLELAGLLRSSSPLSKKSISLARLAYAAGAAASTLFYFHDYHTPPQSPSLAEALDNPIRTAGFFLAWAGGPLSSEGSRHSEAAAILLGSGILCAFLIGLRSVRTADSAHRFRLYPWVAVGLYSLVSGLVTTAGRVGDGMGVARVSRYVSFSLYLVMAATVLLWTGRGGRRRHLMVCLGWTAALLFFHGQSTLDSMRKLKSFSQNLHDGRLALQLHEVYRDDGALGFLYPGSDHLLGRFQALKRHGLLNFSPVDQGMLKTSDKPLSGAGCGFVDWCAQLNPDLVECSGWAYLTHRRMPASNVILAWREMGSDAHPFALLPVRAVRPDVAHALGERDDLRCAFQGRGRLPRNRPSYTVVSGWTVDIDEGRAYELRGMHPATTGVPPGRKESEAP